METFGGLQPSLWLLKFLNLAPSCLKKSLTFRLAGDGNGKKRTLKRNKGIWEESEEERSKAKVKQETKRYSVVVLRKEQPKFRFNFFPHFWKKK